MQETMPAKKGIIFKGDIPIGSQPQQVWRHWIEPYYFNMNGQAGAPPDAFSVNGQNWGFPTYNWEVMEQDNYQWWQKRFRKMAEYFTAYRIDHILGFFRIWEIPLPFGSWLTGTVCTCSANERRRNTKLWADIPKRFHDKTVHQ